jgi:hypothetical protein
MKEAEQILQISRLFLSEENVTAFFIKLDEEVGNTTTIPDLKQCLSYIRNSVDPPRIPPPWWLWIAFITLVTIHIILVIAFFIAFFLLPFYTSWIIAVPLMTFIFFFSTTRVDCQLTNLENYIRKRLGLKKIGGFVGTYILKPLKNLYKRKKSNL